MDGNCDDQINESNENNEFDEQNVKRNMQNRFYSQQIEYLTVIL